MINKIHEIKIPIMEATRIPAPKQYLEYRTQNNNPAINPATTSGKPIHNKILSITSNIGIIEGS